MQNWNIITCDMDSLAEIISQLKFYGCDFRAYQGDNKQEWIIEVK